MLEPILQESMHVRFLQLTHTLHNSIITYTTGTTELLSAQQLSTAQQQDSTLSVMHENLQSNSNSASISSDWKRFLLLHYKQLQSQSTLSDSFLYCIVKSPTKIEKWLFIVLKSLQRYILTEVYEHTGHQDTEQTLHRLMQNAFWVGMARDVAQYCSHYIKYQTTKTYLSMPAPLQRLIPSWTWELVTVDILKVPMSLQGNEYILVAQDYLSKWFFEEPIPSQKIK